MSNFDRFSPGSHRDHTLTRDDHIALLRGPEIYGRRERLGVALQLDILSQVTAHQLVRDGQHRRDCKDTRHIIEGFLYVIYVYIHTQVYMFNCIRCEACFARVRMFSYSTFNSLKNRRVHEKYVQKINVDIQTGVTMCLTR